MELFQAPAERGQEELTFRSHSKNGLIEVGVLMRPDDLRVCARFLDEDDLAIDWGCGSNVSMLWSHFAALYLHLKRVPEDRDCFASLPQPTTDPCWEDKQFERAFYHHSTSKSDAVSDCRIDPVENNVPSSPVPSMLRRVAAYAMDIPKRFLGRNPEVRLRQSAG